MVAQPSDYRWSSYRHNALAIEQPFIAAHKSYLALADTETLRRERYRELVAAQLDACDIDAIRIHTQQQRVYGSDKFRQQIQSLTQRATTIKPRGRPRLSESTAEK
jgi:putative transposase